MTRLPPIDHADLVAGLRRHGFEGPYPGGKHLFMVKGKLRLTIPNPHRHARLLHRCWRECCGKQG